MQTTDVTAKYTAEEIGNPTDREALIQTIADAPKGGIIHIHAYESKGGYGQVANYFYLKGVDYGKMKERSLAKLNQILNNEDFEITTVRNAWQNADGTYTAYKAKNRTLVKGVRETYNSQHPLFIEVVEKIKKTLEKPRQVNPKYKKEGNGVYSDENNNLYVRDCQQIHKTILTEGNYPDKASGENTALRTAIERLIPYGKYRQINLDGRFDYITVGGQLVMQNEGGENSFVGFAEHKGLLTSRIDGLEESLPSVKIPTATLERCPVEVAKENEIQEMLNDIF
jgi:hypothetical protein